MSNPKSAVGRSLMKKRFPKRGRGITGDAWVGSHQRNELLFLSLILIRCIKNRILLRLPIGIDWTCDQSLIKIRWMSFSPRRKWQALISLQVSRFLHVHLSRSLFPSLERLNVTFIPAVAKVGILSAEEKERIRQVQNLHKEHLQIPRR